MNYDKIFTAFYDKVINDKKFFSYKDISEEQAMEIAQTRANTYLQEAIAYIAAKCTPTVFEEISESEELPNLSILEVQLLAQTMYLMHFQKEFTKMKAFASKFGVKDLNQFSPANERSTFTSMYTVIKNETDEMIKNYAMRNRETKKYNGINYTEYSGE